MTPLQDLAERVPGVISDAPTIAQTHEARRTLLRGMAAHYPELDPYTAAPRVAPARDEGMEFLGADLRK